MNDLTKYVKAQGYDSTLCLLYGKITIGKNTKFGLDILIDGVSLYQKLKIFFDHTCKTFWIGQLISQPQSYGVQYFIIDRSYILFEFVTMWIGGDKGFDYVIQNNENIFDLLSEYENYDIIFKI